MSGLDCLGAATAKSGLTSDDKSALMRGAIPLGASIVTAIVWKKHRVIGFFGAGIGANFLLSLLWPKK